MLSCEKINSIGVCEGALYQFCSYNSHDDLSRVRLTLFLDSLSNSLLLLCFLGDSWYPVCLPATRHQIFYYYWTPYRLYGWYLPGKFKLYQIKKHFKHNLWDLLTATKLAKHTSLLIHPQNTRNFVIFCIYTKVSIKLSR